MPFWSKYIKPLEKRKNPKNQYIGFDVETIGDKNKFWHGGIFQYKGKTERIPQYDVYYDRKEYQKKLLSFKNRTIVAHNLAFDFTATFFESPFWNDFEILWRNSNILVAKYSKNGHTVRFIDTFNFFPTSLNDLAEMVGSEKLEKPSFIGQKPKNEEEKQYLEKYNKRDCKICVDFMEFFEKGITDLGGTVKLTSASTSFDVWRRGYLDRTIHKNDEDEKDKIFKSYHGGRTECFKRGRFENVHYYDINSLYPSVMRRSFPDPESKKHVKNPTFSCGKSLIRNHEGVSKVTLFMDRSNQNKPLIPKTEKIPEYEIDGKKHSGMTNEKLLFRKGRITKWVTHVELRKALDIGYTIEDIHETIFYTETIKPFEDFVNDMYSMRQKFKKTNNPYEAVVKLVMNSLYGKFGQKQIQKTDIVFNDEIETEEEETEIYEKGDVYDETKDCFYVSDNEEYTGTCQVPIWASYITAYARLVMYPYINSDGVIYTDTDSIITTKKIGENSDELGKMDYEKQLDKVIVVRAKFYAMKQNGEWNIKIKGVPHPTEKEFFNILDGESVTKEKLIKVRESIRRRKEVNSRYQLEKNLNLNDDKRVWDNEQFTLKPQNSIPHYKK